jgi:prolyl-tRNA synthetase
MSNENVTNKELTSQEDDFSKWYIDVIKKADLMSYSPVRGCIVFKPDGYEIWENIQHELNTRFKATGHRNAYFPLFIPESFFQKEKEHIEGFNPELPWVTEAGGEKLEERLAIRPTSETMIGHMYAEWINSYRDLPLLINQWANVVRWEKRTLPFLRTTEFLWQEGHTAHEDESDARRETMQMLDTYREFAENVLALPVISGQKTPSERFAGAVDTYSIEVMMKDGKAVQAGTSHYLGTKFSVAFDIKYLDRDNQHQFCHTTSWGVSTRLIGAIIMAHGDNKGLVLPPKAAPTQVILIPIGPPKSRDTIIPRINELSQLLKQSGLRVKIDDRADVSPGWKFNEYEMRGIPIRLELGPRDLENDQVVLVSRVSGQKLIVNIDELVSQTHQLLSQIHQDMFEKAKQFRDSHITTVDSLDEFKSHLEIEKGFALAGWCGSEVCESTVKEEIGATSRNIPFEPRVQKTTCLVCGDSAKHTVLFGKSY